MAFASLVGLVALVLVRSLALAQLTIPEKALASREKDASLFFIVDASPLPLRTLIERSHVVLVGTVASEKSYLSQDAKRIFTDYEVRPVHLLFDSSGVDTRQPVKMSPLIVTMEGGRLQIAGRTVSYEDKKRLTWKSDATLLLFLRRDSNVNNKGKYVLVSGKAGLFRLNDEERVRSLLRHSDSDAELGHLSIAELSERIESLAR